MGYEAEQLVAIEAVDKAALLCERIQALLWSEDAATKADSSPVTVADYGAQALICSTLKAAFPQDPIIAEEDAAALRHPESEALRSSLLKHLHTVTDGDSDVKLLEAIDCGYVNASSSGRCWVVDPIDGTRGFLNNGPYIIALALLEEGIPVLGILCYPRQSPKEETAASMGYTLLAVRGEGLKKLDHSTATWEPLVLTPERTPPCGTFAQCRQSTFYSDALASEIFERAKLQAISFDIDSQYRHAQVALGACSAYLRLPYQEEWVENIWDHAAGTLIVEEAGGRVSDLRGKALDFSKGRVLKDNQGIVVTNGAVHQRVLDACAQLLSRDRGE